MPECGCRAFCGDLPEDQDAPDAVCKVLPPLPPEGAQLAIVVRDGRTTEAWPSQS